MFRRGVGWPMVSEMLTGTGSLDATMLWCSWVASSRETRPPPHCLSKAIGLPWLILTRVEDDVQLRNRPLKAFRSAGSNGTSLIPSISRWIIGALRTFSNDFTKSLNSQTEVRWTRRRRRFSWFAPHKTNTDSDDCPACQTDMVNTSTTPPRPQGL